jgi:hypothetical protein
MKRKAKYNIGDCLSFNCDKNQFIAGFVSGIFKSYYDITLIDYLDNKKPTKDTFMISKFFGTRFGDIGDISYAVDKSMIKTNFIDNSEDIEWIDNLDIPILLDKASYHYDNNTIDLLNYYKNEISVRIDKTTNAEMFPEIGFAGKHLIDINLILNK